MLTAPDGERHYLSSARQVGQSAANAGVDRLLLTHLWPGTAPAAARDAAADSYDGEIDVATAGLILDLSQSSSSKKPLDGPGSE
jgi:ribonuclease BN (tRNA processing enzyme)